MQQVLETINNLELEITKLTSKCASLEKDKEALNKIIAQGRVTIEETLQRELQMSRELSMVKTGLAGKEKEVLDLRSDETKRAKDLADMSKAFAELKDLNIKEKEGFNRVITSLSNALQSIKGVETPGDSGAAGKGGGGGEGGGVFGMGGLEEEGEEEGEEG
jgi:hypothetical protein